MNEPSNKINKTEPRPLNSARRSWLPISINRRLVLDGLYFARGVPLYPIEKSFELADIAQLRKSTSRRISWAAIFVKAYALARRSNTGHCGRHTFAGHGLTLLKNRAAQPWWW